MEHLKNNVNKLEATYNEIESLFKNLPNPEHEVVENARLLGKNKQLEDTIFEMKKENNGLKKEIDVLKRINERFFESVFSTSKRDEEEKKQFTKISEWSAEDIDKAKQIYATSPEAYKLLLKMKYPFPAIIALQDDPNLVEIEIEYM